MLVGESVQKLSMEKIHHWAGGTLTGDAQMCVEHICIDSRSAKPGDLFLAIAGERFDGHDFLREVYDKGCRAFVVSRDEACPPGTCAIRVEDTKKALARIAAGYRRQFDASVIGITGSVGKTTTKEYIYSVLSQKGKTLKTQGNLNNEIGLPLTIMELTGEDWAAVLEMGMNHAGEMERLAKTACPDIGIITNIGVAHIENLGSREAICAAKVEIVQGMRDDGILLLNGDEPLLYELKGKTAQKIYYYGLKNPQCDFLAEDIVVENDAQHFKIKKGFPFSGTIYQKGVHNIYNALCAAACGHLLGIEAEKMEEGLRTFQNAPMRQNVFVKNGITIIDDCYNANPDSMRAAIDVLCSFEGRKIALLGDMLELGSYAKEAHEALGRYLAQKQVSYLFLKGEHMKQVQSSVIKSGMPKEYVFWAQTDEELAEMAKDIVTTGDCLLFKGSRSMQMEGLMALLLEEREKNA